MPRPSAGKIVFIMAGIAVIAVWPKYHIYKLEVLFTEGGLQGLRTMSIQTLIAALNDIDVISSLTMAAVPVPGTTTAPAPVPGITAAPPAANNNFF